MTLRSNFGRNGSNFLGYPLLKTFHILGTTLVYQGILYIPCGAFFLLFPTVVCLHEICMSFLSIKYRKVGRSWQTTLHIHWKQTIWSNFVVKPALKFVLWSNLGAYRPFSYTLFGTKINTRCLSFDVVDTSLLFATLSGSVFVSGNTFLSLPSSHNMHCNVDNMDTIVNIRIYE
jgi:hypothetical protein